MTHRIILDFNAGLSKIVEELPERMHKLAEEEIEAAAAKMVSLAKSLCPVHTGSLRNSIRRQQTAKGVRVSAGGYVTNPITGKIVDYARYAEAYRPFMALAWNMAVGGLRERIEERIADECSR